MHNIIMQVDPTILEFDWLESSTKILDASGNLTEAGTVVRINNNLIFLKSLSIAQLNQLKNSVINAVDHEISKR